MGKNRNSKTAKKEVKPFVVTGVKKANTKAVATNLKKLNFHTKAKTEESNKSFKEVQKSLVEAAKRQSTSATSKKMVPKTSTAPPDVSMAAEEFSKL